MQRVVNFANSLQDYILEDGLLINSTSFPFVTQPIAITEYPADIWYRTVSSLCEQPFDKNTQYFNFVRLLIILSI